MTEQTPQAPKVEQMVGDVVPLRRSDIRLVPEKKGTSPNQGYAATGRTREYLEPHEVTLLLEQAKKQGRDRWRNYTIILMMFRHGLRAGEASDMRWSDLNFPDGRIHVRRLKGSRDSTHFLEGDEIRALKRVQREYPASPFTFVSSTGKPLAPAAIASMIKRNGKGLFAWPVHAHMLRHSCGHYLAMQGHDTRLIQDYLGHANIRHTVRYTALSPGRFKGLWK